MPDHPPTHPRARVRLRPRTTTLIAGFLALGVTASMTAPATADPIPQDDPAWTDVDDAHEAEHGTGAPFTGLTDAESNDVAGAEDLPESPDLLDMLPPDPEDLPAEWTLEQPAQEVEPAPAESFLLQQQDGGEEVASVPAPPTKPLPSRVDAAPGWQYSYSCDPNTKPGTQAFGQLLTSHYGSYVTSYSRACRADNSQHYEGRAVDWAANAFNPTEKARADSIAAWLTANNGEMAKRFGIMSFIWNRKAWDLYTLRWRDYNGPSPHTDHMHFAFTWDGAMQRTSWWSGTAVTTVDQGTCRVYAGQYAPRYTSRRTSACPGNLPAPPPSPYPVVLPGARNAHVTRAQEWLGFTGSDVDGSFGPLTLAALLSYQSANNVPRTGVLDNATWRNMIDGGGTTPPPGPPTHPGFTRVGGKDRYTTAANLSRFYPAGVSVAYVTAGQDYPDALAAGARAGSAGGPVLLAAGGSLPSSTRSELTRLRPRSIVVVGGTTAVPGSVITQLRQYTNGTVSRIGGTDRYDTAARVARSGNRSPQVVYLATGNDYPDALAGGAHAGTLDGPVLLTRPDRLSNSARSALQQLDGRRLVVLGGGSAVSTPVAREASQYVRESGWTRLNGDDRFGTARLVSNQYTPGLNVVYVSTGRDYPDALGGAARAASNAGPMLLTQRTSVPEETKTALRRLNPDRIVLLGGNGVATDAVARELISFLD